MKDFDKFLQEAKNNKITLFEKEWEVNIDYKIFLKLLKLIDEKESVKNDIELFYMTVLKYGLPDELVEKIKTEKVPFVVIKEIVDHLFKLWTGKTFDEWIANGNSGKAIKK